jgi:hypothetical protein
MKEYVMRAAIRQRVRAILRSGAQAGQSTTEYVLVIVVAATVALMLLNWARGGAVSAFFEGMFSKVTEMFA